MSTLALMPGGVEIWIILGVVLLLFGGRKLPELARSMGSSITQFKKGLKDTEADEAARLKGGGADADSAHDPSPATKEKVES